MKERKFKYRIYSLYQFFTFIGIILIVIGFFSFAISASKHKIDLDSNFWNNTIKDALIFTNSAVVGVFSSLWLYLGLFFMFLTYPIGLMIIRVKNQSIFDRMFLLFLFAPIVSNIFCLLAQIYIDALKQVSEKITREEINAEKTQIMHVFEENVLAIEKEVQAFNLQKPAPKAQAIRKPKAKPRNK